MSDAPRPLLVGECPPPVRASAEPLDGRTAAVLLDLLGGRAADPRAALRTVFEPINLCATAWDEAEARGTADRLRHPVRVLLGRRVAGACGHRGDWYEWVATQGTWTVSLPHPSGLNRLLNDPTHRRRCGEEMRRAIVLAAADREHHLDLTADLMSAA